MIGITTNTDNEITTFEVEDLPKNVRTSGYIQLEEPTTAPSVIPNLDELTANITTNIENNARPRNRAERRAWAKKLGKKGREQFGTIGETAKKLNYIELIQKLRQLNEEKEQENE